MSRAGVTVNGLTGVRPDREALTGVNQRGGARDADGAAPAGGRGHRRRGGGRGRESMVPEAELS
ncbi:MAG: hypothetical protein JWN10_1005, partial [Solirubrobacterales bacterium]|nr:hypothetical protein [Solirubrobacterales bacterium]